MTNSRQTIIWSIACYLPPVGALALIIKRADSYVCFHAKQALLIWVLLLILSPFVLIPVVGPALVIVLGLLGLYILGRAIVDAATGTAKPALFLAGLQARLHFF